MPAVHIPSEVRDAYSRASSVPVSQKQEYRRANHSGKPLNHSKGRESHVCIGSNAVSNEEVDPRHWCRLLKAKTPASMETLAPQETAAVGRARPKVQGFAVRLRRSIAAAAAITVTSTEISSLELKPIAVDIDGPLVLWDAAGRELGPHLAQRGVGEEVPV